MVREDFSIEVNMVKNKSTVSKHAQALEERGFTKINKEESLAIRRMTPINRKQRLALERMRYRPWYTATETFTLATDETGQTWQGPPLTDLSGLGFEDRSAEVLRESANLAAAMGKPKTFH